MAIKRCFSIFLIFEVVFVLFSTMNAQPLTLGFYEQYNRCPGVETLIWNVTAQYIYETPSLAASLLRMHFHDCFVRGCDASVLLDSTNTTQAEKSAIPNLSLRGFNVIDAVKAAVEQKCPGIVSCADILTLVARNAVTMIHGPYWTVQTGRRDGQTSIMIEALINLPPPFGNITVLKEAFASKGLNVKDLVVLSGAHTIGVSHCPSFSNRLYNFTGKGDTDPSLDPTYITILKQQCSPGDVSTLVPMDETPNYFDVNYYTSITRNRGLFESDAALLNDAYTQAYVALQAATFGSTFNIDFAASMVKMGNIGVLTGMDGEIRKTCSIINTY